MAKHARINVAVPVRGARVLAGAKSLQRAGILVNELDGIGVIIAMRRDELVRTSGGR
jgi:hypothetical protein